MDKKCPRNVAIAPIPDQRENFMENSGRNFLFQVKLLRVALMPPVHSVPVANKPCEHTTCLYKKACSNAVERWCGSSSGRSRHHKAAKFHPCCKPATLRFCSAGEKLKGEWNEENAKIRTEGEFVCRHDGCGRSFETKRKRLDHEKLNHRCTNCTKCKTSVVIGGDLITIPQEEPSDDTTTEDTDLNAILENEFQEMTKILNYGEPTKIQKIDISDTGREAVKSFLGPSGPDEGSTFLIRVVDGKIIYHSFDTFWGQLVESIQDLMNWMRSNLSTAWDAIDCLFSNPTLLRNLLLCDSFAKAKELLLLDRKFTNMLISTYTFFSGKFSYPTIDACLSLKDTLGISDNNWNLVHSTFYLPKHLSTYNVVKYRKEVTDKPFKTKDGLGYAYHIREMISKAVITEKIPNDAPITIKLSLDAGTVIKGSRKQAECVQMDVVKINNEPKNPSVAKSNKNSYIISIFSAPEGVKDPESNEIMKEQLEDLRVAVSELLNQPLLETSEGIFVKLEFLLCVDMKCLCELLGK